MGQDSNNTVLGAYYDIILSCDWEVSGAIFMFSLCPTPSGQCFYEWRLCTSLAPWLCGCCPKDTYLENLALVGQRAYVLDFKRFVANKQFLTRYLSMAQQRGSRQKY